MKVEDGVQYRNSMLGVSNIHFDEIDQDAEKVIKGSNINFDEECKNGDSSKNFN